MCLSSFESGDWRRVRVTNENKRTKKIQSRSTRPNLGLRVRSPAEPLSLVPWLEHHSLLHRPGLAALLVVLSFSNALSCRRLEWKSSLPKLSLPTLSQITNPNPLPSLTGTNPLMTTREDVDGSSGTSPV